MRCATVAMSGDLLLHEPLWEQAARDAARTASGKLDFRPVLAAQEQYLETADLAICQLETPLAQADGPYSGYPAFNVPPQILDAVSAVGYDACTTASNHSIDDGTAGVDRTLDALDEHGLEHTGSYRSPAAARQVLIVDTPAARVAVITGTFSLNGLEPEAAWQVDRLDPRTMIAKAKQARAEGADIVLGAIHAGDEYSDDANAQQREAAHMLADSGEFSLVYGHHSHSVQPIERYGGTWIAYGLGNTIAAHATDNVLNTEGLMVRAQFSQEADGKAWEVARLDWLPATFDGPQHRWCPVAADRLDAASATGQWCISEQADTASRARIKATVESMAGAGGAVREWLLSGD
ncbi:CapA family protein [Arthrobacter mangrovi]|uniref:Metallophosphatase n=1 Tax=Arthrobacter mangrovi TaxID=2966350 RepID=A0ABQ5MTX5_9MICC|nr:CapA family protein [Arthrobacter mangrovi]GLB67445.1 metallophosphatase [Arthrobacter mangrovi]